MKIQLFVLVLLIIVAIVATIFAIYFWYKSCRYTQQGFAFAALAAITSILLIATIGIFIGKVPWQIMFTFFDQGLEFKYTPQQTTVFEYGLFIFLIIIFLLIIRYIYDNWSKTMPYKQAQDQEFKGRIIDVENESPYLKNSYLEDTSVGSLIVEGSQNTPRSLVYAEVTESIGIDDNGDLILTQEVTVISISTEG